LAGHVGGIEEKCRRAESPKKMYHFEDLGVVARIILEWILKPGWECVTWILWLRAGTVFPQCERLNFTLMKATG
jgi:hypothetical protein